ncbi:MAG TPA: hypothetical protein VH916_03610, partial [Dehalococcoidia bacterium]
MTTMQTSTAPATATQLVGVTSELMQDYRLATPVTAGAQIALAPTTSGQVEVFSIGTNYHIYNIYPDPGSDTGWSQVDLNFPAKAEYVAVTTDSSGAATVYAADNDNNLYSIVGTRWGSGWEKLPNYRYYQPDQKFNVGGLKAYEDSSGDGFPIVLDKTPAQGSNPPSNYNYCIMTAQGWYGFGYQPTTIADWTPARVQSTDPGNPIWPGVFFSGAPIITPGDQGVIGLCFANGASDVNGRYVNGNYSAIACATNSSGYAEVFAVSGQDKGLYYLQPAATPGQFTPVNLSDTTQIAAIAASTTAQGQLEVFAIGTDSLLYYVRQDSNAPSGWTNLIGLEADVRFARIEVMKNADGNSEAFATTTSSDLYHIYQDPQTTDWTIEEVELAARGDLEQFSSYTVQLTTYDANQLPTANTQVTIYSDEPVLLNINGDTCFVDASRPWQGVSNMGGQITISGKTAALAVPPLTVWTSAMPATDRIAIDASGPVRAQLSALDDAGQALLNAQTASSNGTQYSSTQLVQGSTYRNPNVVASVAQGVKAAMSLGATQPSGSPTAGVGLHPRTDPRVARYLANYDGSSPNHINPAAVPEQHWQIDFTSGAPVFRSLTAVRSAALVAEQQRLPNVTGFLGLDVDWGDVFSAIADGVASVASVVVNAVSSGISATITLIIKGAQFVYNATISLVEQTLDLAQEVF